ncbi:hypothetical protein HXX76_003835 [Chlamydomonas incerta]|uniref:Metallo-beta-lactamase domain-containing protein n=1 Tax=Chlamydomonas incerta TaxID=51695 RepID=A0A835W561_CHLIN|nr:hypothetical protein HXX76_003835 [Chlamydomonas incerta]|eukprot:KAG2440982.1 hypothetical protein HXX76_003835 [Chlamydomonas incerta]
MGYGVTAACLQHVRRVPPCIYISHNHGDHAGELPLVLAVEGTAAAAAGRPLPALLAHPDVMAELVGYRLRELHSTGRPLESFASFHEVASGSATPLPACGSSSSTAGGCGLTVRPFRARHSETCYGLVIYDGGQPVLGWTADSGYDEDLYMALAEAPLVLVDARAKGSAEHAGFADLARIASLPALQGRQLYVTGYGRQDEAPRPADGVPAGVRLARPGLRIALQPAAPVAGTAGAAGAGAGVAPVGGACCGEAVAAAGRQGPAAAAAAAGGAARSGSEEAGVVEAAAVRAEVTV